MEAQVENAIEIAWNPRSDQSLKSQAFEFINQLRREPQGWSVCLPLAIRQPRASEVVRHVALEVVNNAIQSRKIETQDLVAVKGSVMQYLRDVISERRAEQDPISIENKLTQTVTYLFSALYESHWPSFFDDLLSLTFTNNPQTKDNTPGTRFYLKTVTSIHDEIADVLLLRSREELKQDNHLKDLIRERDIVKITRSWHEILLQYRNSDPSIIDQCLCVISRWASWTDLSLILNDTLLNMLFEFISQGAAATEVEFDPRLRDSSINTIVDIFSKKMPAHEKLQLMEILRLNEVVTMLVNCQRLSTLRYSSMYDTDLAELVGKLVNNTVVDIISILEAAGGEDEVTSRANAQLRVFLPYALRFLSDEYDEICSTVIPCLTDTLTLFRRRSASTTEYASLLGPILQEILKKMKYDETAEWGSEDAKTDEAEFAELRKRLQNLQQAVAAVDEPLYINTISGLVAESFERFQSSKGQVDWREIDLALHEMYLFGQLGLKNGALYNKSKPVSPAAESLVKMMVQLVESDVASFSHPAIHIQYMEICVRYSSFFEANPSFIPRVLERFIQFVHHDHVKVKVRSWYLFHRFIKQLRQHLGNVAQTVIQAISDLLPIKAELAENASSGDEDNDGMSSDEDDQSADARFSAQLYLYEAVGNICSATAVPVESQVYYIQSVLNPLYKDFENNLGPASAGDERAMLQVHQLMMAMGTLAHGFCEWMPAAARLVPDDPPPVAKEVTAEFSRTAEVILVALETLNHSLQIRAAARSAFSRLLGVLGNRILEQLPRWIDGLLSRASSKDEMATFLRLLDQVLFGFKDEIFGILNTLLTPLLQRVFAGMSEPTNGTDDEIQLVELKSQYLAFLMVILNHGLDRVFITDDNQPIFETFISTLEHLARDGNDMPTAKYAFGVLTKMITIWGGPDIPKNNGAINVSAPQPELPGFDRFMIQRFSPLIWALPSSVSNFNAKDAQTRGVLGEAAVMKKTIWKKTGMDYLTYLRDVELKNTGMEEAAIEQFLTSITSLDTKQFRTYFLNIMANSNVAQ